MLLCNVRGIALLTCDSSSIFYALFAAWILWDKEAGADTSFEVKDAHQYLPIPFLDALLHDIRHSTRMKHLGLNAHLARAVKTFRSAALPVAHDLSDN